MRFRRDELVAMTHTAPERFVPGDLYRWREGTQLYRITRVRKTTPTRLSNGGTAPCWEVRGVPVDDA